MTTNSEHIQVIHLLPKLERKLISLLRELSQEEWAAKALPNWTVKDVAAHLLDGALRRLSIARDGYFGEPFSGSSYEELGQFLNGLNADWVKAFKRISPTVLVELLERSSREFVKYLQSLDPDRSAAFPVAWAGESASRNWFDVAREYTERWHHQQQIREAVGKPGIMGRELYYPVLETFMRALPVAYADVAADEGTRVAIRVSGRAGGEWSLIKKEAWELSVGKIEGAATEIVIRDAIAWKFFTKGLSTGARSEVVLVRGEARLAAPIAMVKAIMG